MHGTLNDMLQKHGIFCVDLSDQLVWKRDADRLFFIMIFAFVISSYTFLDLVFKTYCVARESFVVAASY